MKRLEFSYAAFEALITKRTGPLPEGVRRYLKLAYYAGASGMLSASKLMAELPPEEQQPAMDAVIAEIAEVLS